MNVFREEDVRQLLSDTLKEHAEVDLVVVAKVLVELDMKAVRVS